MQKANHSIIEDIFALISAGLFVAFGIYLFQSQDLLIGGAAGIALLATYAFSVDFSVLFFLINLPFYVLAWTQIGKRFTINTFISVTTISVLSKFIPSVVNINQANPLFTAVFGGILIGVGMLIMFRHSSSLGGLGILAYFLQQKYGIRAGFLLLTLDGIILMSSLMLLSIPLVLLSVLAAFCLNMVLSLNHRPERYTLRGRQKHTDPEQANTSRPLAPQQQS